MKPNLATTKTSPHSRTHKIVVLVFILLGVFLAYNTGDFWLNCPSDIEVPTAPGKPTAEVAWDNPEIRSGVDEARWSSTRKLGFIYLLTTMYRFDRLLKNIFVVCLFL